MQTDLTSEGEAKAWPAGRSLVGLVDVAILRRVAGGFSCRYGTSKCTCNQHSSGRASAGAVLLFCRHYQTDDDGGRKEDEDERGQER